MEAPIKYAHENLNLAHQTWPRRCLRVLTARLLSNTHSFPVVEGASGGGAACFNKILFIVEHCQ